MTAGGLAPGRGRFGLARSIVPGATGRAHHVTIRNLLVIRRQYAPLMTGLVEPFFYLLSVGVGVAVLVRLLTWIDVRSLRLVGSGADVSAMPS